MKLLMLGGTIFLGRHVVEAALAHKHEITLFNRGQHNPALFPDVEKLHGDRNRDLAALHGRRWDAVIDTSSYVPRVVRESAKLLINVVDHYTLISSISVYADLSKPGIDESAPVGTLPDESIEEITATTYGPLKALCEQVAEKTMPGHLLTIRPGLIVGPHDPTDRFTYWPHRVARGGEVLAPLPQDQPVQFIDVRDLAEWIVRMVEARKTGIFHATGPAYPLTIQHLLEACQSICESDAHFTWVSEEFLLRHEVEPYIELPLWIPSNEPEAIGHNAVNCNKAIAAGLTFRPLTETIRDTLTWDATLPPDRELRAGLASERERQLLQAWRSRTQ